MRILCLSDAFWPDHTGGITKSLLTEVEGLVELGHDVTVVCRRLVDGYPDSEDRNGYRVCRYASPLRGSVAYRLYPLSSMFVLPRFLRSIRQVQSFDVAYTHDLFQVAGFRREFPQLPYVHNYHSSAASEIQLDASRGKYGPFSFLPVLRTVIRLVASIERRGLVGADRIIVHSSFMGNDLLHHYRQVQKAKMRRVPLAVDTKRFSPPEDQAAIRDLLGLPGGRPILLTVRRLVARTGIDNLISAMSWVVQDFPDALLLVGGAGYLREHLQRSILDQGLERNVRLLGFISEELLPAYYQAADLFVLPTLEYEGFGLVTIESLACGTPVLGTPVGATPEVLGPVGDEFLFRDPSAEAIALGVNKWLGSKSGAEVRQRCRAYCVQHFDRPIISRRIEHVLAEAANIDSPVTQLPGTQFEEPYNAS